LGLEERIAKPTLVGFGYPAPAEGEVIKVNKESLDLRRNGNSRLNGRRSNIEIIADMLRVGEKGAGKTEIMYSANMSYTQIQKYLSFLINHGFIDKVTVGNPHVTYHVTAKGARLLDSIDIITELLGFQEGQDT
jgi:predicted transcriptional regulator